MKSFFTVLATGIICLFLFLAVREVCKTWLTVEMIRAGAPIIKKAVTK